MKRIKDTRNNTAPEKVITNSIFDEHLILYPETAKEFSATMVPHIKQLSKNKLNQVYQNIYYYTTDDVHPETGQGIEVFSVYTGKTFAYQLCNASINYGIYHVLGKKITSLLDYDRLKTRASNIYTIPFDPYSLECLSENNFSLYGKATTFYKVHRIPKVKIFSQFKLSKILVNKAKYYINLPDSLIRIFNNFNSEQYLGPNAYVAIEKENGVVTFSIEQKNKGCWTYTFIDLEDEFTNYLGKFKLPIKELYVVANTQKAKEKKEHVKKDGISLYFNDTDKFQTFRIQGFQQVIFTEDYLDHKENSEESVLGND